MKIIRALLAQTNRLIGKFLFLLGYQVERRYRNKKCTLPILDLAIRALLAEREHIHIVQIGAFDGATSDPIGRWIGHDKIRAVLVEPQPRAYQRLLNRFIAAPNTILVEAAITDSDGIHSLYIPKDQDCSQVASLSQGYVHSIVGRVKSITVRGITVDSLLRETGTSRVDLLQIDTEGKDYTILQQFFALGFEPIVVNLESFHLDEKQRASLYGDLIERGYQYIDYNLDTLAIKAMFLRSLSVVDFASRPQ